MTTSLDEKPVTPAADEINLLDYWRVIWKRRRFIGWLTGGAVLIAMVVSLLQPKIYQATASILPPLSTGVMGGLGGAAAAAMQAQAFGLGMPGMPATSAIQFLGILNSQSLAGEIVKRFDLAKLYETEVDEDAIKTLKGNTKLATTPEMVITISVEATDPKLAADLANAYVEELDKRNSSLATGKAGQHRRFIEKRLTETESDLEEAEVALTKFQTQSKAVALPEQASAAIKAAAEIQARIIAVEVQMEVLQNYLTPENPDLVRLKLERQHLTRQLHTLESGQSGKGMLPGDRLHPAFVTVPALGMEYAQLLRELKLQETLSTLLTSQYEQAKLDEARDTPTVQMLDRAVPPMKKTKPKIRMNMMIAGLLGLLTGIFIAFILEAADPETLRRQTVRFTDLRKRLRKYLPFVRGG